VRHAYLYGRAEADDKDWAALRPAARGTIRPWIQRAVKNLCAQTDRQASHLALARIRIDGEDR
jgi:hypothetical protein